MKSHYDRFRKKSNLYKAWDKVFTNGIKAKSSDETKIAVKLFKQQEHKNIEKIYRRLLKGKYKFSPAKGIAKKRENKSARPIVIATIQDRVVKRSILNVLQDEAAIKQYFLTSTSFGGIKDVDESRGVKNALEAAHNAIKAGASWLIKSDIIDFFTNIPKDTVLEIISNAINDDAFNALLKDAIQIELSNLSELGQRRELFPIYEIGVAQGCCLSPLLGNILLYSFDNKVNGQGVTCLRYIDDFIILGSSQKDVNAAMKRAKILLKKLGLTAYHPMQNKEKAQIGLTKDGFDFLGCEVFPGSIRPSKESRKRLLKKISDKLSKSIALMDSPERLYLQKGSLIHSLVDISNIIVGWGNQYSFCNDPVIINNLDEKINEYISIYMQKYIAAKKSVENDLSETRRLLGVQLLSDCKHDPIIK